MLSRQPKLKFSTYLSTAFTLPTVEDCAVEIVVEPLKRVFVFVNIVEGCELVCPVATLVTIVPEFDDDPEPVTEPEPAPDVDRQTPTIDLWFFIAEEQHSGEIRVHLFSALRGCKRSGDNARLNRGELGSELFVRANPFLLAATWPEFKFELGSPPGLYDWVVLDAPG